MMTELWKILQIFLIVSRKRDVHTKTKKPSEDISINKKKYAINLERTASYSIDFSERNVVPRDS